MKMYCQGSSFSQKLKSKKQKQINVNGGALNCEPGNKTIILYVCV
jgi:hypothetical protein